MLAKVLRDRAQVEVIRTGMAIDNTAMRSINEEMGFKSVVTAYTWQAPTAILKERLGKARP
jgi:hypothetical protein